MVTFSNPCLRLEIPDYPLGYGKGTGLCVFECRFTAKKGWKFYRTTTGKPKSDIAYSGKGCIVTGDDGRTYLLQYSNVYGFITIYRSDMKCADPNVVGDHSVFPEKEPERFAALKALIQAAA